MHIRKIVFLMVFALVAAAAHAQTVLASFNYFSGVNGVAVDYVRNRAYAALPNYYGTDQPAVQVLDGRTQNVITTFSVPTAKTVAVNLLTGTLYVAGTVPNFGNSVVALDPQTGAVQATIQVTTSFGKGITSIAVDPITNELFAADQTDDAIGVIDLSTNTLTTRIALNGYKPAVLGVDFVRGTVYAGLNNNQVAILSEASNTVTYATYGANTQGVTADIVLGTAYVCDAEYSGGTVGVFNTNGTNLASIPVGSYPVSADTDFITGSVFAVNQGDGTISKINTYRNTVITTFPYAANSIAVNPSESTIYAVGPQSVTVLTEN